MQDYIVTAGRRAGKTTLAAAVVLFLCVLYPGYQVKIIGPRKKHGQKIINFCRQHLPREFVDYDEKNISARFLNMAQIHTATYDLSGVYEVGDKFHLIVYDEGALFSSEAYDRMAPATIDYLGLNLITTTHRGHSWVYEKILGEEGNACVIARTLSALENTFLPPAAHERMRAMQKTLSERAYASEVLGIAIPESALAFPQFSDENILDDMPDIETLGKYTEALLEFAYGAKGRKCMIGCDFNTNAPNYAVVIMWDDVGKAYCVGDVSSRGTTDKFGYAILEYIYTHWRWTHDDVVIIADASGEWQAPTGPKRRENPSYDALRGQGWLVRPPGADGRRANPLRWQRLEIMRTMLLTGAGDRNFFVHRSIEGVIDVLQNLPMDDKKNMIDVRSKYAHEYDALTYPIYRVWGTPLGRKFFKHELVAPNLVTPDAPQEETK